MRPFFLRFLFNLKLKPARVAVVMNEEQLAFRSIF